MSGVNDRISRSERCIGSVQSDSRKSDSLKSDSLRSVSLGGVTAFLPNSSILWGNLADNLYLNLTRESRQKNIYLNLAGESHQDNKGNIEFTQKI